jgi:two-component system, NarL family, response regulator DegU
VGMKAAIEQATPDIKIIAICNTGEETVNKSIKLKPDVILLSNSIASFDCFEVTKQIRERLSETRIVTVCHDNAIHRDPLSLLNMKSDSYAADNVPANVMIHIIRDVIKGARSISPEIQEKLLEKYQDEQGRNTFFTKQNLTNRQVEVLSFAAQGLSNREIAEKLFIAENTVKTQMSVIIRKLNMPNRQRAAMYAIEKNIIPVVKIHNA